MRDLKKDKEYFDQFIANQDKRIAKFELARSEAEKKVPKNGLGIQSVSNTIFTYALHRLIAMYSRGDCLSELSRYFATVEKFFYTATVFSYSNLLWFSSIAALLNKDVAPIHERLIDLEKSDRLLAWLLGSTDWESCSEPPRRYESLLVVISGEAPSKPTLKEYLADWYESNADAYWYDSLENSNDIYVGYWCFEVAAIVKSLKLGKNEFAGDFFPSDF